MTRTIVNLMAAGLCAATMAAAASPASADDVRARLERIGEAAAIINADVCHADMPAAYGAAVDAINAMPRRQGLDRIALSGGAPVDFLKAYQDAVTGHDGDAAALEDAVINGMVHAVDSMGAYGVWDETPKANGNVKLTLESDGDHPLVIATVPGGPAERGGLLPGDRLVAVDGVATAGSGLSQVVERLRGAPGSTVTVQVERDGTVHDMVLTRAPIRADEAPPVQWRLVGDVAVITIMSFPNGTARRVEEAVDEMRVAGAQPAGYVLDLRGNPGGLLEEVVETADLFIDGGEGAKVVPFGDCHPEDVQNFPMKRGDLAHGAPVRVIISGSTASGAEWLAAMLRERRQAVLVGQPSFGNARVFTVVPIGRDAYLKLTTGLLATPSGSDWDGKGLTPDVAAAKRDGKTDPTLDAALASVKAR